jgi:hypothetical protein
MNRISPHDYLAARGAILLVLALVMGGVCGAGVALYAIAKGWTQ